MKVLATTTESTSYKIIAADGTFLNETSRTYTFSTLDAAKAALGRMHRPDNFAILALTVVA